MTWRRYLEADRFFPKVGQRLLVRRIKIDAAPLFFMIFTRRPTAMAIFITSASRGNKKINNRLRSCYHDRMAVGRC